eukprot:362906-Chlamydomonas_euryale.AAC.5
MPPATVPAAGRPASTRAPRATAPASTPASELALAAQLRLWPALAGRGCAWEQRGRAVGAHAAVEAIRGVRPGAARGAKTRALHRRDAARRARSALVAARRTVRARGARQTLVRCRDVPRERARRAVCQRLRIHGQVHGVDDVVHGHLDVALQPPRARQRDHQVALPERRSRVPEHERRVGQEEQLHHGRVNVCKHGVREARAVHAHHHTCTPEQRQRVGDALAASVRHEVCVGELGAKRFEQRCLVGHAPVVRRGARAVHHGASRRLGEARVHAKCGPQQRVVLPWRRQDRRQRRHQQLVGAVRLVRAVHLDRVSRDAQRLEPLVLVLRTKGEQLGVGI